MEITQAEMIEGKKNWENKREQHPGIVLDNIRCSYIYVVGVQKEKRERA